MNEQRQGQLSRIVIKGFKSIKECELDLNNVNVLIGANGAGKTNFLSVFSLLKAVLRQDLSRYVAKKGGASALLYNGGKVTDKIVCQFSFGSNTYSTHRNYPTAHYVLSALQPCFCNQRTYSRQL